MLTRVIPCWSLGKLYDLTDWLSFSDLHQGTQQRYIIPAFKFHTMTLEVHWRDNGKVHNVNFVGNWKLHNISNSQVDSWRKTCPVAPSRPLEGVALSPSCPRSPKTQMEEKLGLLTYSQIKFHPLTHLKRPPCSRLQHKVFLWRRSCTDFLQSCQCH